MRYQSLKQNTIKLASKAQTMFDAKDGVILVPDNGSKVFVHWTNDSGKLMATYTMSYATKVVGQIKLINALDKEIHIQTIEL